MPLPDFPPGHSAYDVWQIDGALFSLTERMPAFFVASLRVVLVFAGLPAPFGALAPMRIRTAATLMVTLVLLIPQAEHLPRLPLELVPLLRAATTELFIGAILGMVVRMTMAAAEAAGTFAGQAMGLGFAGSVDPTYGESVVPTAYLLDSIAALIFFTTGCHHILLKALAATFQITPIGSALDPAWQGSVLTMGADLVSRGLQIAAPVIASMFIVQVGIAFVSRIAPRVSLFAFAFSISVGAGMVIMWLAAPAVCTAISRQIQHIPDALSALGTH